jgi:hypothetical protein
MKAAQVVKILALSMVLTAVVLMGWIGLVYAVNVYSPVSMSAEAVLNMLLAVLMTFIGLPFFHRAFHRHFWAIRRKLASGELRLGDPMPALGAATTTPPPRIRKTRGQIVLYTTLYIIGMASLLAAYAPLDHQAILNAFLGRFSAGRSSFSSLATLVVIYLPMVMSFAVIFPFLNAHRKRAQTGGAIDPAEALRLQDNDEWLVSFAAAYVSVGFFTFVAGNMILNFM